MVAELRELGALLPDPVCMDLQLTQGPYIGVTAGPGRSPQNTFPENRASRAVTTHANDAAQVDRRYSQHLRSQRQSRDHPGGAAPDARGT